VELQSTSYSQQAVSLTLLSMLMKGRLGVCHIYLESIRRTKGNILRTPNCIRNIYIYCLQTVKIHYCILRITAQRQKAKQNYIVEYTGRWYKLESTRRASKTEFAGRNRGPELQMQSVSRRAEASEWHEDIQHATRMWREA
jgi:hypothetical protein